MPGYPKGSEISEEKQKREEKLHPEVAERLPLLGPVVKWSKRPKDPCVSASPRWKGIIQRAGSQDTKMGVTAGKSSFASSTLLEQVKINRGNHHAPSENSQ